MNRRELFSLTAAALAARGLGLTAPAPAAAATAKLAWWSAARYGLFVHWGPYSIAGVEASWPIMVPELVRPLGARQKISEADYVALAKRFDPRAFDADAWVAFAQRAGMRYLVITTKHHDGYCLFDAPSRGDYKITRSPYGRDLLAQLAEACERAEFPLGFYYSPPDMHHPGYRDTSRPARENWFGEPERPQWSEYLDAMEADLRKLLTDYGDVAVLWFDGLFEHEKYDPARFHHLVQELSPKTLVNDRLGAAWGHFVTPEQATPEGILVKRKGPISEITLAQFQAFVRAVDQGLSAEQYAALFAAAQRMRFPTAAMPLGADFQPWETCMTLGRTWAYDPEEPDYKSAATVVRTLIETSSRGGNLLLNVGPQPDGKLPAPCTERLLAAGRWLDEHGDSIYGTTYCTDFGPLAEIAEQGARTTQGLVGSPPEIRKDGTAKLVTYVHLLEPPADGVVRMPAARADVSEPGWRARVLKKEGADQETPRAEVRALEGALELRLAPPLRSAADMPTVLAVERA
jgi:alpha-L-fucosidase